jgi:putative transcriptional regulator
MSDPRFRRAVIYLLQNDEEGSAGVVLTRRYPGDLSGVELPQWLLDGAVLHEGGPVAEDSLLALAARDAAPAHLCRAVGPGICVVDLDGVADSAPFQPVQLFVGYAGWGAGQLEDELARHDWLVVSSDPFDVLATDPEDVWEKVLRRQSGSVRLWSTLPHVVTTN